MSSYLFTIRADQPLRRRSQAMPPRPAPSRLSVIGSGTAGGGVTGSKSAVALLN